MQPSRRHVITAALAGGLLAAAPAPAFARDAGVGGWRTPRRFGLADHFTAPEIITRIAFHSGGPRQNYLRVQSASGAEGVVCCNLRSLPLTSIMEGLVAPFFLGKDAAQMERLVDEVHVAGRNYKFAGMPFWNSVSFVENAALDMLGRVAGKPVHALFGAQLRDQIPIYQSNLIRDPKRSPDDVLDQAERDIADSGAQAVKLKVGGRMSRNRDVYPGYTEALIARARERLGDAMTLYFDANGSYDAIEAVRIGRLMEDVGAGFFEEPCPWQDEAATRLVASGLTMDVAGGEQDSSLAQFAQHLDDGVVDLIQPDTMYVGGFIRLLRIADIAAARGRPVTAHSPRHDPTQAYMLHFAAITPNLGPHQEHRANTNILPYSTGVPQARDGLSPVPTGDGWGCEFDPALWDKVPMMFEVGV